ncbi:VOC family protein [Brevibacillus laterosporus]|uniref:VOC family protein n=1 Tax=Brevibacillus laterosporus TaxID=1465 RepID=UPI00215D40B2|nr:VOC family protein [Brevibacillus laterosporus]MCR8994936.1 VOC family protein [Brevibacillus laterosporus]
MNEQANSSGNIGVVGFSHVTLQVSNLEQSLRFYCEKLQMKMVHQGRTDAYLEWGSAWICLLERPEIFPIKLEQQHLHHCAFYINEENFDIAVDLLRKREIMLVKGPIFRGGGKSVYFHDPDKIMLELHTSTLHQRMSNWT